MEEGERASADEELRRISSCKICYEPYTKCARYPVSLLCGHTFCSMCVRKLSKDEVFIRCGICRKILIADYRNLSKNFTLSDILEHFNILIDDSPNCDLPNETEETKSRFVNPTHCNDFRTQLGLLKSVAEKFQFADRADFMDQLNQMDDGIKVIENEVHFQSDQFLQHNRKLAELCRKMYQVIESHLMSENEVGVLDNFRLEFDDFTLPPVLCTPPASRRSFPLGFDGFDRNGEGTSSTTSYPFFENPSPPTDTTNNVPLFNSNEDNNWNLSNENEWTDQAGNWHEWINPSNMNRSSPRNTERSARPRNYGRSSRPRNNENRSRPNNGENVIIKISGNKQVHRGPTRK